jgi:hypothetical protein
LLLCLVVLLFLHQCCAALTAAWEVAIYSSNGVPDEGGVKVVNSIKYCISSSKAFCCVGPYWKTSSDFSTSKNGKFLSADLEINLFNDVSLLVNL